MRQFKRQSAIFRLCAIACAVLLPMAAHPQDAKVNDQAAKPIEEVIVTGSLIPQTNMISSSPITEISTQDILLEGTTDTSELLNGLPQVFQNSLTDFSSTTNPLSTPGGIATVNLRGLGPQRTLVLVNGRRLGVGDANTGNPNPAPDINQIPTQLIERVDVVTGGASAIYGSDAVAGVVNFIMKKDFEGIEVDYQYGFARHDNDSSLFSDLLDEAGYDNPGGSTTDGNNYALSLLMGTGQRDGSGNVTAFFSFRKQDPILQGDRDFAACKLNVDDPTPKVFTTPYCTGSPNSNEFINVYDDVRDLQVSGNEFIPWNELNNFTSPPAIFNSNPLQQLLRPDSRYTAGVFANQEVNEKVNAYFEFSYMDDKSSASIAPSAAFLGGNPFNATGGILINCDNPLMSAQQVEAIGCNDPAALDPDTIGNVNVLVGRRNIEGGGRVSTYEHENFRYTIGADGELGQGWNYDTYFQYYYSTLFQSNENYLSSARINKALQVVDVDGVATCKSKVDGTDTACVPWNIFTEGGVDGAQVAYLNSLGTSYGTVAEKIVSGQVTNDLGRYGLQLPWATDGVGIALGLQYRWDEMVFTSDAASSANDLSGFGGVGTNIDDSIYVMEEYIELRVPLVQGKAWAQELLFETAYRSSDYNLAGRVGTFKFGLQWQPNDDVRLRTGWNRAIRAPNVIDLFTPQSVTNTSVVDVDPCAGGSPTRSLEECERTGVTAAQYGSIIQCPAGQCSTLQGGSEDLDPETADTFTIGVTFTPTFIENFTASIDYYDIQVDDIIGSVPIDISLQNCLDGDLSFCGNVVRTTTGNLFGTTIDGGGYVIGASQNIAKTGISGVDVQLNHTWTMPGSWGDLSTALIGSWIDAATTTNLPGTPEYDCAGLYGATCQTLNPDWRSTLRLSWSTPWDLLLSVQWRYIDGVALDTNSKFSQLNDGQYHAFNATLPSVSYFDLSAIWNAPYGIDVRAGIDNIFDRSPPPVDSAIAGTGSPNTFPTYDLLGQVFFAGITKKF